jgi:hypothetical protein
VDRRPAYCRVFEFWLEIFGVAFGLGVVSGIVIAFQFGTNRSALARMSVPIQGPLLSYVYSFIFAFGTYYIYRLLRAGPQECLVQPPRCRGSEPPDVGRRPAPPVAACRSRHRRRIAMVMPTTTETDGAKPEHREPR